MKRVLLLLVICAAVASMVSVAGCAGRTWQETREIYETYKALMKLYNAGWAVMFGEVGGEEQEITVGDIDVDFDDDADTDSVRPSAAQGTVTLTAMSALDEEMTYSGTYTQDETGVSAQLTGTGYSDGIPRSITFDLENPDEEDKVKGTMTWVRGDLTCSGAIELAPAGSG